MDKVQFVINHIPDIIGLIGVVMVLIAFYLLNTHKVMVLDMSYQWLNFVGAVLILISLFYSWNLASVLIEIAWILISLLGIYRSMKHKSHHH